MTEAQHRLVRPELRSPRAAAIAGIVYSGLTITVMLLGRRAADLEPQHITAELLQAWSGTFRLVLLMVPFAGIAFLWFTGVVRDRLQDKEDRFFATIFFGSGIAEVLLIFLWGAILATTVELASLSATGRIGSVSPDIYVFSNLLMNQIIGDYALRMAGLYMTAVATLWFRTRIMPRWLILATYALAWGFLLAAPRFRDARLAFPFWVLVVSAYILIMNYRRPAEDGGLPDE